MLGDDPVVLDDRVPERLSKDLERFDIVAVRQPRPLLEPITLDNHSWIAAAFDLHDDVVHDVRQETYIGHRFRLELAAQRAAARTCRCARSHPHGRRPGAALAYIVATAHDDARWTPIAVVSG